MKKIFILVCSCALLAACNNSAKTNKSAGADSTSIEVTDIHNAENSLDYEGTYKGVFPAADCPGIETTLTLNPDKTFSLHSVYIDRDSSFDEKGTYTLKDNLLTLNEEGGELSYYKVEENHLRKLTMDKQEITGELADHIKAVGNLGEKMNIPVYTTARIHAGINRSYCMTEKLSSSVRYLEKQEPMTLEDFHIESFEVPHDGTDNVGYCIEIDGKVFSFLTDLGEITPTAAHYISEAHYLILEANYDEEMLKMGPYPQYLKERIASKTGHMSNSDTAEFLAENITEHLRYIWLCHLSKDNNHPELAYKTVEWKLKNKGVIVGKDVQLLALKRNTPSELYVFE